jgi:hypothetical protein
MFAGFLEIDPAPSYRFAPSECSTAALFPCRLSISPAHTLSKEDTRRLPENLIQVPSYRFPPSQIAPALPPVRLLVAKSSPRRSQTSRQQAVQASDPPAPTTGIEPVCSSRRRRPKALSGVAANVFDDFSVTNRGPLCIFTKPRLRFSL